MSQKAMSEVSWFTDYDFYLFREGTYFQGYNKFGAHLTQIDGVPGTHFAVWAPNANSVCVIGDFNSWDESANRLSCSGDSGIWTGFVPGFGHGTLYKYSIQSSVTGYRVQKADPYAFYCELRPRSASIVWDLSHYNWSDGEWMERREKRNRLDEPMLIYEVHLGSWMRVPEDGNRWLSYREVAGKLAQYVQELGFTHVQFLPVTEYPLDESWGYQVLNYFAPTSRFGPPEDFMYLVDILHQHNIGVIVDWVPAHFPKDEHGLAFFDGTHLYEHSDPKQGLHPDWGTLIFNYGRHEVSGFLISSALFWLEKYHIDGLRVDAVASMLYLDYSRQEGDWIPNTFGGRENLDAIRFLRQFNEVIYGAYPDVLTVAEESTAWPMVSRPTYVGGLGFGLKWNMGWMHDVLSYMSKDPVYRQYHHNDLTFGMLYAFHENFILPLSHDEVVHQKRALLSKMPGDYWQQMANLRLLFGLTYSHPGKKLIFMGGEIGQWREWDHQTSLDWHLLEYPAHRGIQLWVKDLNHWVRTEPALYELDFQPEGFQWIDCNDSSQSVLGFVRFAKDPKDSVLCVFNFTPVPRYNYRIGVAREGYWEEVLNSDAEVYGGSKLGNLGGLFTDTQVAHGQRYSLNLCLPPLAAVFLRFVG